MMQKRASGRHWLVTGLLLLMLASPARFARPAVVSRRVRYLLFPPGSNMGIEAALSLPVRKNVNVAMNVEANYVLPYNITQFYPEYQKGSLWTEGVGRLDSGFGITRRRVYATIERFMTQFGLNGQACLLRAICETSESSLRHNGLFGDLLHIMFTPSSSKSEDLPESYARAEEAGTLGQDCSQVYPECTSGILQLFTMLGD